MSEQNLKIAKLIFDYLRGTITPEGQELLEDWLEMSEEHRLLFQRLTTTEGWIRKREIYRRFDRYYNFKEVQRRIQGRKQLFVRRKMIAAVAILLVSVGIGFYVHEKQPVGKGKEKASLLTPGKFAALLVLPDGKTKALDENFPVLAEGDKVIVNKRGQIIYPGSKNESPDTVEVYHEIRVPRGGEYQVSLADGTQVWLNSESSIYYPIEFKKTERRIYVSGEVFLEVAKDSLHPFIVSSEHMKVKVLGTKFNVRDYSQEENAMTTLMEGKVEVVDARGKTAVLKPSEQCIYNQQQGESKVVTVDPELFVSWKDGVYLFKGRRLEDILNVISRWYDVEVFYQNAEVKDVIFSGRLKRYENAEGLLKAFEKVGGVRFSIHGKLVMVKSE